MNILILNWRDIFHPLAGGAEQSLFEHAKYWKKKKAKVIWFASSFPKAKKREVIEGITIIRKGSHFTVHLWAFIFYLQNKFGKFDIVVDSFHFLPFFAPFYMPSKKVVGLINEVAGTVWYENIIKPIAFVGYHVEPYFFQVYKKNRFITGSQSTKDELISLGLSEKNIYVVHHGVHVVKVKENVKKEKNPTILFLGRISYDKGIQDIIKVYLSIKKKITNIQLWIIGREEKSGMLNELFERFNVSASDEHITYFGFISQKEKFVLLKKAWFLLHPSKKEGWGLNVIEAASQETPTIGYNVSGLRDSVINGKTGVLVSSGAPQLLASTTLALINDKRKYINLSKNAVQWAKHFDWLKSTKKSWQILKQVYAENNEKK